MCEARRIRYSVSEACPYERVALLPVSLSVQKGLKVKSDGFSLLPAAHFNPKAALGALLRTRQLGKALVQELRRECRARSENSSDKKRGPSLSRRFEKQRKRRLLSEKRKIKAAKPRLRHFFDGAYVFVRLEVSNEASVEFECEARGKHVKAPSLCIGPKETHNQWMLLLRRQDADTRRLGVRRSVALLERLLRLFWKAFPQQQGSLSLQQALVKDTKRIQTPRAGNRDQLATTDAPRVSFTKKTNRRTRPPEALIKSRARKVPGEEVPAETVDKRGPSKALFVEAQLMQRMQISELELPKVGRSAVGEALQGCLASQPEVTVACVGEPCQVRLYFLVEGATPLQAKKSGLAVSDSYQARPVRGWEKLLSNLREH